MTLRDIKTRIEQVEQKIEARMPQAKQEELVVKIKAEMNSQIGVCKEYYHEKGVSTSYGLDSLNSALNIHNEKTIFEFYTNLHDDATYHLPYHCSNIVRDTMHSIEATFHNVMFHYDNDVCTTSLMYCLTGGLINEALTASAEL